MPKTDEPDLAALRQVLPVGWESALAEARPLAHRLAYLSWAERARILDDFVWTRARESLSHVTVTEIINRMASHGGEVVAARLYADYCSAVIATVLRLLNEGHIVCGEAQALTFALSADPAHHDAVLRWSRGLDVERMTEQLSRLPGYALLLMIRNPNDSAESFIARDAFWTALRGCL